MENDEIPVNWRGTEKSLLPRSFGMKLYPLLIPTPHHTILFKIPKGADNILESYPENFHDIWDDKHVKMPCSKFNLLFEKENNLKKNRWDIIVDSLSKPILTSEQFEDALKSYNLKYKGIWRFHLLHSFFENVLTEEETDGFFEKLLPKIINLALKLPILITSPIPLLKQNNNHSISISQIQIACLLANAFLCTFPHRNNIGDHSEYNTYPHINFNGLFQMRVKNSNDKYLYEKLKCIINYFKKVTNPNFVCKRAVTYSRRYLTENELPTWLKSTNPLTSLHIASDGTIEDNGDGMYQIDFANKFIGGGVLGWGCVQEEIRFLICPELLVSQLFSQKMLPTESIIITGAERFNDYSGYSNSFKWDGNYTDNTPIDDNYRRYCTVVAIDAIYFQNPQMQFAPKNLRRELNKAYSGFSWGNKSDCSDVSIATGNWGCGAFRGDCHLKSLLQLLSAAEAKRDVVYFTFGETKLRDSINDMHSFLRNNKVTVGEICRILIKYNEYMQSHSNSNLFEFIYSTVTNSVIQKPLNKQMSPAVIDDCNQLTTLNIDESNTRTCRSPTMIEATPEKICDEDIANVSTSDNLNIKLDVVNTMETDVKFLPVNQFKLKNDKDRNLCIQQQKNSWIQLNDSKKAFQSVLEKPNQSLSTLKRERNEENGKKRAKRKIYEYFQKAS
ncbi:poly(ADP-ribose) glycohydrolase-like isoform X2 [Adelges cooleyi]|uniref:poly(ADP-ribose) glycohydrolase-like isoform X2 n=1 Tax=Adelges cooleyi TaxID=133065 RepID=UPI0021803D42|nr:poly(ADP-ribose) glycohydrolase-like isoform X2 [Adelges cooleyi]